MAQSVIRNGLKIKGTLSSGAGDNILTRDATTKDVGEIGASITSLTENYIFVGDATNLPVGVPVTGDISVNSTGVVAISSGVIVDADVNSTAAIALSKLAAVTASRAIVSNGSGVLTAASTTAIEIGYVSGVTSAIQTQLNGKEATITGGASTITTSNLTASRALISTGIGKVGVSTVLSSELAFLSGTTSSVQNQLDSKLTVILTTPTEGDVLYLNGSGDWVNLGIGSTGEVLTVSGGVPVWSTGTSNGLPIGGTTGQYLRKNSNVDYDTYWDTLQVSDVTDLTATAAEINILDGVTATTTEINYLSGVTSSIQTQINNKLNNSLAYNALFVGDAGNHAVALVAGGEGDVLTVVSGTPTWQTPTPPGNVSSATAPSVDNELTRYNGTVGDSIQGGTGITISDAGEISFPSGGALQTGTTIGNTLLLRAYDNDTGPAYVTFATLTAGNTPTFDLSDAVTKSGQYIYRVGGTDVTLADGGTGASLADPGADRILFWDDSAGQVTWLTVGTNLTITGTTLDATGGGGGGSVNSVSGTTDRIDITGTASDPIVDIAATYVGQNTIETVGTVSVGTWNADVIDFPYGGTGLSSLGTASQVLRVNSGATALEYATIAPGHVIKNANTPLTQRANIDVFNGLSAADDSPDTNIVWGGQLTNDTDIGGNSGNFAVSFGRHLGGTDILNSFNVTVNDGTLSGLGLSTNLSNGIYLSGSEAGVGKIRLRADQVYVNSPFVLGGYTTVLLPTASSHSMGLVYDTTTNTVKFSNGSVWSNISNSGTVTSIDVSGGTTGLSFSGGPITSTGTITISGTLDADNGGTGQSSYTIGDLLYASSTTVLSKLAAVPIGSVVGSAGTSTAPAYLAVSNGLTPTASTLKWGGALTASTSITGAFAWNFSNNINGHLVNGTWTATANSQFHLGINPNITARNTVSDTIVGVSITPTLTAAANSQTLVTLDLTSATVPGAFTGITAIGIRLNSQIESTLASGGDNLKLINSSTGSASAVSFFRGSTRVATISGTGSTAGNPNCLYFRTDLSAGNMLFATASNVTAGTITNTQLWGIGAGTTPTSTIDIFGSVGSAITSVSSDTTLDTTHYTVQVDASGSNRTINLPAAAGCARRKYVVLKIDSSINTVTIDANASETISGSTTKVISTQWSGYMIQSTGSAWVIISTF